MAAIDHKLIEIALERVSGSDFEKFASTFYSDIAGVKFVPTGGVKDGGADGYQDAGTFEGNAPDIFYQASIEENHRQKIRRTVKRLREFGRSPKSLVYITPRPVHAPDKDEEELSRELDVFIRIRARSWIISNVNRSHQTIAAFRSYLEPNLTFIKEAGGATFIASSKHLQSRAVCVFLGQEVERRRSKSPLIESVTDSLILWALDDTDPDAGKFQTRKQILNRIESTLPTSKHFIRGVIKNRLKVLSSKGNPSGREIRWYTKEDKFCLPFETRKIIEEENVEDEYLKVKILEDFDGSAAEQLQQLDNDYEVTGAKVAQVVVAAIELTFENSGLELAAFLQEDVSYEHCPPISDNVDSAISDSGLSGNQALVAKEIAMSLIRRAFYESTIEQREYFGKLSRTYSLLFSLRADPRIVEYFQAMSSKFFLFVGTDILVRALSEHYLKPEDQMTCNMLKILADSGSKLILCEPVLEEIHRHLETTDWEFINYFSEQEPYIDVNIARHASKILIRTYFYAKLSPTEGIRGPTGWKSFIGQFCDYKALHDSSGQGKNQFKKYLVDKFQLAFLSNEDLSTFASEHAVEKLAEKLKPVKKQSGQEVLAINDARIILSVYGKRKDLREDNVSSPYGYSTWWLTQEVLVQKATAKLVKEKGGKYIIRPDFILNFISLSPSTEEVRKTHREIMPTLLGVRLSNRMRADVFHDVMKKTNEALSVDQSRAKVMMGDLSNQLKGDFFKQYEVKWTAENG